jgi:acetyl esterase
VAANIEDTTFPVGPTGLVNIRIVRPPQEALVVVDENDVLRDEGEAYARKLAQAGVRVTSERYNGTIHDFVLLNAISDTPAVRSGIAQATAALRSALHH